MDYYLVDIYQLSEAFWRARKFETLTLNQQKAPQYLPIWRQVGNEDTPPNSEIICVQNVGAKVDMVSYLKK